ncbi:MAG: hypothetical protein WCO49_13860 [Nostocales cyanobacterium ELA608]|jgi:hypothetical protein|uniref:Bacteriocin n=1 Tax=Aphanizomenon flos-aquae WA102 TaxID=1710896 RepID=A0A1B7X688_APHFL|nr:MAG: hypothetical protein AN488_10940 [Anabaena sp. WA113]OBQ44877.1 MAG: hypothetical protein AN484_04965 [Aphanizomenon flos-aquae WA102]
MAKIKIYNLFSDEIEEIESESLDTICGGSISQDIGYTLIRVAQNTWCTAKNAVKSAQNPYNWISFFPTR